MLKPNYAWALQVPEQDSRIAAETATVPSPKGNGNINGYLVRPRSVSGKLPVVLVIHENRGLNPYIRDVARRLAVANFIAFAPEALTPVGGYPNDDEKAAQLFQGLDRAKMSEDFLAAAIWLKSRSDGNGKLGAVRILLWRRRGESASGADGSRSSRRGPVLWQPARRGGCRQNQGFIAGSLCRA